MYTYIYIFIVVYLYIYICMFIIFIYRNIYIFIFIFLFMYIYSVGAALPNLGCNCQVGLDDWPCTSRVSLVHIAHACVENTPKPKIDKKCQADLDD